MLRLRALRLSLRIVCLLLLAGCVDKGKADYDKCVELDKSYDVKGAVAACQAAVAADSNSPSGQAAAKKLLDLQSVEDKLKAEASDKAAREARINKDEPPQPSATVTAAAVAVAQATATALDDDAPPGVVVEQAQALANAGELANARALLEPRVFGKKAKPTRDELKLLGVICKQQKDGRCLKALVRKVR
jgi:hypothetical protein